MCAQVHLCVLRLRIVRPVAKEAKYEGKGAAFRAGTRDWVGVSPQWHIVHPWKSQDARVAGRCHLGGSGRWAGGFSTPCVPMALFFSLRSRQLQDLLRQNHVAYSSVDLIIICQAPSGIRSPGALKEKSRQHILPLLRDVFLAIISKWV